MPERRRPRARRRDHDPPRRARSRADEEARGDRRARARHGAERRRLARHRSVGGFPPSRLASTAAIASRRRRSDCRNCGRAGPSDVEQLLRVAGELRVDRLQRPPSRRRQIEPHLSAVFGVPLLDDEALRQQAADALADQRLAHVEQLADLALGRPLHFVDRHRHEELGVAEAGRVEHALARQPIESGDDLMQQEDFGLGEPGVFRHGLGVGPSIGFGEDALRAGALQNRPAVGHHSGRAANIEIGRRRIEGEAGEGRASRVRGTRRSDASSRLAQTVVRGGSGASARVMSSAAVRQPKYSSAASSSPAAGHRVEHRQERREAGPRRDEHFAMRVALETIAAERPFDLGRRARLDRIGVDRAVAAGAGADQQREALAGGRGDRIVAPFERRDAQLDVLAGREADRLVEFELEAPDRRRQRRLGDQRRALLFRRARRRRPPPSAWPVAPPP